jgi:DNA replication protein DnaC
MADFDWSWPTKGDRELIEELFTFQFLNEAANVVLVGANGVGKTMIAQNLAHQAVQRGQTAIFTTASAMLNDLSARTAPSPQRRRILRHPKAARDRRSGLSELRQPACRLRGRQSPVWRLPS